MALWNRKKEARMTLFGAPLSDAKKGDIVILQDRTMVCVKNDTISGYIYLKGTDNQYYFCSYTPQTFTIIERKAV